jgi:hypothetical protein
MALGTMQKDGAGDKFGGPCHISSKKFGAAAALKLIVIEGDNFAWPCIARATEWLETHNSVAVTAAGSKQGVDNDEQQGESYACDVQGYVTAHLWLHVGAGEGTVRAELWGGLTSTCNTLLGTFFDAQAGNMDDDEYAVFELPLKGAAHAQVRLVYSEESGSISCDATLVVQG